VALVTGASSGIGEATAVALGAAGAAVVAVARRAERLQRTVATIEAAGGTAIALAGDMTEEKRATEVVAEAIQRFGVRVCMIAPGPTRTEVAEGIADPAHREAIRAYINQEGALEPKDVAETIVFIVCAPQRVNISEVWIRATADIAY
jgi:NADP-dependent 3-hydroxy acid dehydrogenase YdfG